MSKPTLTLQQRQLQMQQLMQRRTPATFNHDELEKRQDQIPRPQSPREQQQDSQNQ